MPPTLEQLLAHGRTLQAANHLPEAERHFREVAALHPHHPAAHHALGVALIRSQKHAEAIAAFQKSLELALTPEAALNLIQLLHFAGRKDESVALARSAAATFPDDARVVAELARTLERHGHVDEALHACQEALRRFPNMPLLVTQMGTLLFTQGKIEDAVHLYRQCLHAHPGDHKIHSALLFSLHFLPGMTPPQLLAEHVQWNRRHAAPLASEIQHHHPSRDPNQPLRVGYVSPDFRNHGIGRFIAPLLAHHSRERFHIFAYSDVHSPDALTHRIRESVQTYRSTFHLSDTQLADVIRADQIDILVDLTMHMPSNRLLTFARKPAPVQLTYLAYCSTTGLSTMDYRLTDLHLEGAAETATHYTEKSLPLPSYWCYEAPAPLPSIAPRDPAAPFTFACLNNFAKASPKALQTWAAILAKVPNSRLLLHAPEGSIRNQIAQLFQQNHIAPDRLTFTGRVSLEAYLQLHAQTDIALDPFPYAGGTTSCDALFMGTPVITLSPPADALPTARAGISILSQLNLPHLIARDLPDYIHLATTLACDRPALASLRATLRSTMQNSSLMNAPRFIQHLEAAYQQIGTGYLRA